MPKHLDVCAMRRNSGRHACDFVRSACGSDVRLRLTDEFASQTRGIHIRNRLCFLNGVPAARAAFAYVYKDCTLVILAVNMALLADTFQTRLSTN